MRFVRVATTAIALSVTADTLGAQGTAPLDAVARALGGKDRVLAVRTLILEGRGENLNFGQNHTPDAETKFEVTSFRREIDFPNRRWLLDQTREPRFITANTAPQRQRSGVDGAVAYNIAANGNMTRVGGQAAIDRANELMHHPIGFLQAAFAPGSEVTEEEPRGGLKWIRVNVSGNKFAILVDPATNLPVRTQTITYHPMIGDMLVETEFSEWRDVSGVKLPMRLTQRLENRWTLSDYRVTSARVNEEIGNIAATDSIRAVTLPAAPPAPTVVVDELAPGIWSIAGQNHHTIAIEQSDKILLVEAPVSDARTLAVIAKARELRPGKPLDVLINTHHHFDHAGGLRAAISQGLTIITHQANKDFYEKVVYPRRHFIQQDALALNPQPLKLISVADKHVISDNLRTVEVYQVTGNPHAGTMLIVYLPAERILIQADLYNPPAANAVNPAFPFAANLVENVQRRGLQVDRVVGIHGRPVPFSEIQAAASRAP